MNAPPGRQGYVVMATGLPRYTEMAVNLAASIRVMDPRRPICLVHDAEIDIPAYHRAAFDRTVGLSPDPLYPHVMNKLRIFDASPYDETMYVDADCLLVKTDVDRHWQAAAERDFSITGEKRRRGEWKGVRIEDVLHQEGADYLIQMNAGVFHFKKTAAAAEFFRNLNAFYLCRRNALNIALYKGVRTQTDELYLGVFMGLNGMDCANMANVGENSWMVSTWHALWCAVDVPVGRSLVYKGDNHLLGLPFFPTRVARLSPTFLHFIGLKPRHLYSRLSRRFRDLAADRMHVGRG